MKENLKIENKCFNNCLNIHSESYFIILDQQIKMSIEREKAIEEVNRAGESGSLLLGGDMEEPHYDSPQIY